jgi:hypothetical protein
MKESLNPFLSILRKMPGLNQARRKFFIHVLSLFLSIQRKINFLQLARYSDSYVESSYRIQFEKYFDFALFNTELIGQYGSGHFVLSFDPAYINKSGKATPGLDKYWSGVAGQARWGLEAGVLSVIDIDLHTAFHLDVAQTPSKQEREEKHIHLLDHYAQVILWSLPHCKTLSNYLAVDAYFAKASFINRILQDSGLHVISRLRADADLRYLYQGPRSTGRGAPRKYAGKGI